LKIEAKSDSHSNLNREKPCCVKKPWDLKGGSVMGFRKGQKVEIFKKSTDDGWDRFMDAFVGAHGIITDPDTAINDDDALVEVSLVGKGTFRFPQDCLRCIDE